MGTLRPRYLLHGCMEPLGSALSIIRNSQKLIQFGGTYKYYCPCTFNVQSSAVLQTTVRKHYDLQHRPEPDCSRHRNMVPFERKTKTLNPNNLHHLNTV